MMGFGVPMASVDSMFQRQIPPRVQAAMQFVQWASSKGVACVNPFGATPEPLELTKQEQAAYNAALESLRLYFAGEMDFGDCAPIAVQPPDEQDPQSPVPVA